MLIYRPLSLYLPLSPGSFPPFAIYSHNLRRIVQALQRGQHINANSKQINVGLHYLVLIETALNY